MHQNLEAQIVAALAGLVIGSIIVYLAPRLVAYRLEEPPSPPPLPCLIPLAGIRFLAVDRLVSAGLELLTAALFVGLSLHYGVTIRLFLGAAYVTLLLAIAYIDLGQRLVLNRLSYPGIVLALAGSLLWPHLSLVSAFEGALVGLVIMGAFELLGRGKLGTGDTKLAVLIGAMRGFPTAAYAIVWGIILGGLGAAMAIFVLRRGRREYIPYAPFLVAGAILSLFISGP